MSGLTEETYNLLLQETRCNGLTIEDNMHVAGGEQLALAGFEPAHTGVALASWAMPITARVA
jgi:hypothetical protein